MDNKNFIEKEVVLTIRVPEDFVHEDELMLDDEFANILEKQGWELAKSEEYRDANEEKQVYVLTGTRQKDDEFFDSRVIAVSEDLKEVDNIMFQRKMEDLKNFIAVLGGHDVRLPYDHELGRALFAKEYEEGFITYEIQRLPLIPSIALEKENTVSMNENAIDCTFISVWDVGIEVISNAKFDPISQTVFDIDTANLSEGVLEDLDICTGEYVEINGKRFLLDESIDGTYTFADIPKDNSLCKKPIDQIISDAKKKEKDNVKNKEEKSVYHERF